MNPDLKVYDTEIYIADGSTGLRNGMSCEVEIVAERHPDALYVPVQSIVRVGSNTTAFVVNDQGVAEARIVEVGADNNRMVHILKGLAEGDRVLLAPPLRDSERESPKAEQPTSRTKSKPARGNQRDRKHTNQ